MMDKHPDTHVIIEGHTDSTGGFIHNMDLSRRRARAVADILIDEYGIDPARVDVVGYGPVKNIAVNSTAEGRAQNRRVYAVFYSREP